MDEAWLCGDCVYRTDDATAAAAHAEMMAHAVIAPARVTVQPTTLFDAVCVALESGEFTQVYGTMRDEGNGRCAWGVLDEMIQRAGLYRSLGQTVVHPRIFDIERRAGELLGYSCMEEANDAGEPFAIIAAALRAARIEIERVD